MIKEILIKIISFFGLRVVRLKKIYSIDRDINLLIDEEEPLVFDVGANRGESISRFKKMFPKSNIHSFEPNREEAEKLAIKYKSNSSIVLNNVAVGEKSGNLEFNVLVNSGHSSFKKLIPNTTWLKKRSEKRGVKSENYIKEKINTKMIMLDDYCSKNNIAKIDILKIDTQGTEDKVLDGASSLLKQSKIKIIVVEIIFSDLYENTLSIYDIEKHLIPNKYRLFGVLNGGSLISHYAYQTDHIYVSDDMYEKFKKNKSPFFNN